MPLVNVIRVLSGATVAVVLSLVSAPLVAAETRFPGTTWETPGSRVPEGWSADRLQFAKSYVEATKPTGVIVVQDGRVIATWGDVATTVNVRTIRTGILSALYGIGVAEGRIDLDRTLADLRIHDNEPGLTAAEQDASIRDLLMSRSGVYHGAAYDGYGLAALPKRGSHRPGELWQYNVWDSNALATIYTRLTRESIFDAFERKIALPIGMQDFQASRDGQLIYERLSQHPVYMMLLSARDLCRLGLLYLNEGAWAGTQVIPSSWIKQSTTSWSDTPLGLGYGYMWWVLPSDRGLAGGGFAALDLRGGQGVAAIPAKRLVVAQTADRSDGPELTSSHFFELLRLIVAAAPE